jgi:hypothetical protein
MQFATREGLGVAMALLILPFVLLAGLVTPAAAVAALYFGKAQP